MKILNKYKYRFLVIAMIIFTAISCGGGGDGSGGTGTLKVSMTDSPACGFDQVNITVSMVRVHQSATADENASGWHDITLSPPRKINLTSLVNGVLEDLGQTALPAGHYTQLRLVLVPNSASQPLNIRFYLQEGPRRRLIHQAVSRQG